MSNTQQLADYNIAIGSISRSRMASEIEGNAQKRNAALKGIRLVTIDLAASFAANDRSFDRERFMAACGF
jgi:hypothetical protein